MSPKSDFEEGSYSRLMAFCPSTLGLRVIQQKKKNTDFSSLPYGGGGRGGSAFYKGDLLIRIRITLGPYVRDMPWPLLWF